MDIIFPSALAAATAPPADVTICGKKKEMFLIAVVQTECTEPRGHKGMHYDSAFGRSWG